MVRSTFKIFVSEFNKFKNKKVFSIDDLLQNVNTNLPDEKYRIMTIKSIKTYLSKMVKIGYITKTDVDKYQKLKCLPTEDYSSIDLDIDSRRIVQK